jgi:3-oxoacyl-[acyl-carrier protein] reductase
MSLAQPTVDRQTDTTLEGKNILVTGASRGIGRGIAEGLGSHGANIAVNYRSSERKATEVATSIDKGHGTAFPVQADVAD